jgi:hypothetical protein
MRLPDPRYENPAKITNGSHQRYKANRETMTPNTVRSRLEGVTSEGQTHSQTKLGKLTATLDPAFLNRL